MQIKNGTVWVGMIACMEVRWTDGCYKLDVVIDLGAKIENSLSRLKEPTAAYRMLFLKGGFSNNNSKENIGLKLLTNELKIMKNQERVRIDCIVIFGPLINCNNELTKTGFSEQTYE